MSGEWTPDKVQPPEYPPPDSAWQPHARDMEAATHPTAWQKLQAERAAAREQMDPRDSVDTEALRRCIIDVEDAVLRLRNLLESLSV